jgi:sortase A
MPKPKEVYYNAEQRMRRSNSIKRLGLTLLSLVLIGGGLYLLLLTQSANLPIPSSIDLNTSDDANDMRDRIQVEKMGVEVPYFSENTPATLERGVWWRFPDRGNPEIGGNFILSAHRFFLGKTPQGTRARSPFYKLDKLGVGDKIRVSYKGKWYDYEVTKQYSVKPGDTGIENKSNEPKLTLYTCSLKGSADGRVVIEAKPLFETAGQQPPTEGSPLL